MSSTGSSIQLASGDVFAGKYRLDRQLASGGMGFVWRAWNMQLDIPVAVKVMAAGMADSPDFVARFELEARAAAQIRSPHVVSIYEHGVHQRLPYMGMELLEGEDLNQRLKREKRLTMSATTQIVRGICKALQRAHDLGIVHRDIKPANVFLARDGDEETVKVLDFGIAKVTLAGGGGNMTATGEMIGTPNYMSPEHIRASKHVDHRADLWSVSVIAFRALTGQLPFTGQILDVVERIITGAAPVPSALAPDLSPAIDAFFARALARNIDHRFQSARELSAAVSKLVGCESLVEAWSSPEAASVDGDERTTIPGVPPKAPQPAPPEASAPESAETWASTVRMNRPGGPQGVNPASGMSPDELRKLRKTMPLTPASQLALAQALAVADQRLAAATALASPPAPLPQARPASKALLAPILPVRPLRTWWVVLASALVMLTVVVWASMYLWKSWGPKPAPAPAASAQ